MKAHRCTGVETYVRLKISPRFLDVGLIMIQQTTREEDEKFGRGLCVCALLSLSRLLSSSSFVPSISITQYSREWSYTTEML